MVWLPFVPTEISVQPDEGRKLKLVGATAGSSSQRLSTVSSVVTEPVSGSAKETFAPTALVYQPLFEVPESWIEAAGAEVST